MRAGYRIASLDGVEQNASRALPPISLFLCGDVMTGRGIDQILPQPSSPEVHESYVVSAIEYVEMAERANGRIPRRAEFSYIWGDALAELRRVRPAARIVNLETSITTSDDYQRKSIHYRMHPANTPCLKAAAIDCCTVANNHVLDWGPHGLEETLQALHSAGIRTTGAGCNLAEAWEPAIIPTHSGGRVIVFAAGDEDSGIPAAWAARSKPGVALLPDLSEGTAQLISRDVMRTKRPGDIAILSIHWGDNWGYDIPRRHREFAHTLIDEGAVDVIYGHSSHHPKAIEIYKDQLILYGCGDFLNDYEGIGGFEQFRANLVLAYFPTLDPRTGALVQLTMAPFEIRRFRLQSASELDAAWLRERMAREVIPSGTPLKFDSRGRLVLQRSA